jgi:hypothetical protein
MSSLRYIVSQIFNTFVSDTTWVAIWKEGRSWNIAFFKEEMNCYNDVRGRLAI